MNNVRFIPNVPYFRIWANIFDYKNRTKRKDFFIDLSYSEKSNSWLKLTSVKYLNNSIYESSLYEWTYI